MKEYQEKYIDNLKLVSRHRKFRPVIQKTLRGIAQRRIGRCR